jgi:sugar O-acyltransferase (sialic acid O-acetyltransferase NeuD family)
MRKTYIVGAGGHSRAVLSIIRSTTHDRDVAVIDVDKNAIENGELIMGVPVLTMKDLLLDNTDRSEIDVYMAIGDNRKRERWWREVVKLGFSTPNLISPHAIVDPTAKIGSANILAHHACIGPECQVGDNNIFNTGSICEHESMIGSHCHMAPASAIAGRVRIKNFCFVGIGAKIIDNISISDGVVVGAGAILLKNVDREDQVYFGVPAKMRGAR